MGERGRGRDMSRRTDRAGQSPQFVSYHASRRAAESEQGVRPSKTTQVSRISIPRHAWLNVWSISVLLVIACIAYSLTLAPNARLTITNSQGVPLLRDRQQYQQGIDELLATSIFHRSKLTIDTQSITQEVQQRFPELATATVTLPFMGHRPIVEITTARPAAYLTSGGKNYILNSDGKAIADVRDVPKSVSKLPIPAIEDASGMTVGVGKSVLTRDDVKFITTIYRQFSAKGLSVERFELPPIPAEIHVLIANEPLLKCNVYTDARVIAGQYLAYRDSTVAQKTPAREYVDLRVEGKVFVK